MTPAEWVELGLAAIAGAGALIAGQKGKAVLAARKAKRIAVKNARGG